MSQNDTQLLEQALSRTNSEVTIFFIVVIVAVVIFAGAMTTYTAVQNKRREKESKTRSEQRKEERTAQNEREKEIIHVITENTAVMSGLKSLLEISTSQDEKRFERVHSRLDSIFTEINTVKVEQAELNQKFERSFENQINILNATKGETK